MHNERGMLSVVGVTTPEGDVSLFCHPQATEGRTLSLLPFSRATVPLHPFEKVVSVIPTPRGFTQRPSTSPTTGTSASSASSFSSGTTTSLSVLMLTSCCILYCVTLDLSLLPLPFLSRTPHTCTLPPSVLRQVHMTTVHQVPLCPPPRTRVSPDLPTPAPLFTLPQLPPMAPERKRSAAASITEVMMRMASLGLSRTEPDSMVSMHGVYEARQSGLGLSLSSQRDSVLSVSSQCLSLTGPGVTGSVSVAEINALYLSKAKAKKGKTKTKRSKSKESEGETAAAPPTPPTPSITAFGDGVLCLPYIAVLTASEDTPSERDGEREREVSLSVSVLKLGGAKRLRLVSIASVPICDRVTVDGFRQARLVVPMTKGIGEVTEATSLSTCVVYTEGGVSRACTLMLPLSMR
ncbi:hypothetical protein KIPB_010026, partial [Kipferlia bialata]|eukprot:g10026.t1